MARTVPVFHTKLLRLGSGFIIGADDEPAQETQPCLHTILIPQVAVERSLEELELDDLLVEVVSIRRQGIRGLAPELETRIQAGDVLVLRGAADGLAAAKIRLLQG